MSLYMTGNETCPFPPVTYEKIYILCGDEMLDEMLCSVVVLFILPRHPLLYGSSSLSLSFATLDEMVYLATNSLTGEEISGWCIWLAVYLVCLGCNSSSPTPLRFFTFAILIVSLVT